MTQNIIGNPMTRRAFLGGTAALTAGVAMPRSVFGAAAAPLTIQRLLDILHKAPPR